MILKLNFALAAGLLYAAAGMSAPPPQNSASDGLVHVTGTVPDESARVAIISRLRELYGAEKVVDRLDSGGVVAPPGWSGHVVKTLGNGIRDVRQGQLEVNGTQVTITGNVANETRRQQVASEIATVLNPTYTVNNGLRVPAGAQALLDQTLADRVVEFESGSAILTPTGVAILDEMAAAIARLDRPRVDIIGHTDSTGNRATNIALSLARADTVKDYLTAKGIPAAGLSARGAGPDRPVTPNDTPEGRARNRRIEFRLAE
ncbi:OmpA family protein [Aromatoleum petrolei]|uniref:OmpA family protein n=1 Tax=Aromatoleum petrolei TaxID=76116 RepID=A0ABX1MRJ6_9RHOO|nr:OmpA family protein [Aromatoleum petrolei]NMF90408.1 OmpA family protein [Aromatoleum petrolei]QTQ35698.1 OmpA family protein [Aromatoleum petrolei]